MWRRRHLSTVINGAIVIDAVCAQHWYLYSSVQPTQISSIVWALRTTRWKRTPSHLPWARTPPQLWGLLIHIMSRWWVHTTAYLLPHTHTNLHAHIHTCTHTNTLAHIRTQPNTHTNTLAHIRTQPNTHTHTHTHKHTWAGEGRVYETGASTCPGNGRREPSVWPHGRHAWELQQLHAGASAVSCIFPYIWGKVTLGMCKCVWAWLGVLFMDRLTCRLIW
jgi:hypothetical protein